MSDDNTDRPIRMISFAGEGVFSPVLDSQIVVPLRLMGKAGPQLQRALLVLTSIRFKGKPEVGAREKSLRDALPGVRVFFKYRAILNVPLERRAWARKLRAAISECGYDGPEPIIVHCRGQMATAAAALLKQSDPRIRVLFDIRGAQSDEVSGRRLLARYLRRRSNRVLAKALAEADAINTVSRKLADYLRDSGALRRAIPSTVIGCCADTERFHFDPQARAARRRELGLDDRFVVCYCGAMSHWQRPDALAEAFAAISRAMPDAHMLIVSREPDPLLAHLKRFGVRDDAVTARAAPHDQVASVLMSADVGLLLREDTLTNRVASPVKFAEYLRCGVPVILTHYVGDFSDFVNAEGVGRTVDFPIRPEEMVEAAAVIRRRLECEGDSYRSLCSRTAGEWFSWKGQLLELVRLYEMLR